MTAVKIPIKGQPRETGGVYAYREGPRRCGRGRREIKIAISVR